MADKEKPVKKFANVRQEMDFMIAQERKKALESGFKPEPSDGWKATKGWWLKATEDERKDMIYGLAFDSAAKPRLIAKYFSIKEADLKPYQEQLNMGEAARILKINTHQMRWAASTNVPNAKFFLGMQFAGQVQNPVHDDAPSLDEKKENSIKITVVNKDTMAADADGVYVEEGRSDQPLQ